MKKLLFSLVLTTSFPFCYSQNYDLIVKKDGDSIACRLDSITTTQYFFEMRIKGTWVHIHIDKSEVIKHEAGVVDMKSAKFINGTSIIEPYTPKTVENYPGTAIFMELGGKGYGAANVDFRIQRNHRISIGLSIMDFNVEDNSGGKPDPKPLPALGFMYYYIIGKNKSFFELGIGMSGTIRLDLNYTDTPIYYYGVIGYRYQKPNGLLFRAGLTPITDINSYFLPAICVSIGYSFKAKKI